MVSDFDDDCFLFSIFFCIFQFWVKEVMLTIERMKENDALG